MNALFRLVGHLHPLIVHFPVACTLLAAFVGALAWRRPQWESTARFLLVVATLTALAALATGLAFSQEEHSSLLPQHRALALATFGSLAIALSLDRARASRPALVHPYRAALMISALLVGATGHTGGTMVFGAHFFDPSASGRDP